MSVFKQLLTFFKARCSITCAKGFMRYVLPSKQTMVLIVKTNNYSPSDRRNAQKDKITSWHNFSFVVACRKNGAMTLSLMTFRITTLSITVLSAIMLSVIMMSVAITLNIMLSAVMLNVVAPRIVPFHWHHGCTFKCVPKKSAC